jgi:hypothetical protein
MMVLNKIKLRMKRKGFMIRINEVRSAGRKSAPEDNYDRRFPQAHLQILLYSRLSSAGTFYDRADMMNCCFHSVRIHYSVFGIAVTLFSYSG